MTRKRRRKTKKKKKAKKRLRDPEIRYAGFPIVFQGINKQHSPLFQELLTAMAPYLLAGLGNPGDAYKKTRHNAGFMVIDRIANDFSISMKTKSAFGSHVGSGFVENTKVIVAKPMAYMNLSGSPLRRVADYYSITSREMLVVHDDIDLAFGRIKIKEKGGHAGHNGIRSIIEAFGGGDFVRLRVGIGRSEAGIGVADHVLGKFSSEEAEAFDEIVHRAADAAVWVLTKGPKAGMNEFN